MKKLTKITLTLALTLIVSTTAWASNSTENAIDQKSYKKAREFELVKQSSVEVDERLLHFINRQSNDTGEKKASDIKSSKDLLKADPYKVYMASEKLINALIEDKSIEEALSDTNYRWEFPVRTKTNKHLTVFGVEYFEGKWQAVELGDYLSPDQIALVGDQKKLAKYLEDKSIITADTFAHIRFPFLHTDFLYIFSQGKETFIPLSYGKIKKLEDGNIYSREDIVNILKENQLPASKSGELLFGTNNALPKAQSETGITPKDNSPLLYFMIGTLSLLGFIVLGYRIKKN